MNEPTNQQAQDEVAAAEAALKAAQERLDAARKRAAADDAGATGAGATGAAYAAQQSPYAGAQAQQASYSQQSSNQQTYNQPNYGQPSYSQPTYASPTMGTKDHVAAGLLAILFGMFGVHKFYLGYNTSGFIMLGVSVLGGIITFTLAAWVMGIIGIVEGILYLTKSQSEFDQMYVFNKREWF